MNETFPYRIDESGVHQSHGNHEHSLTWKNVRALKKSLFSSQHYITGRGECFAIPGENSSFIELFFRTWQKHSPDQAKKAAFDYAFPNRAFAGILLVCCLFLAFPLAGALFIESRDQYACTQELQAGNSATEAKIVKAKKQRKGFFLVSISFSAQDGTVISGKDQFLTEDEKNPPATMPVVYANSNPQCWTTPSSINSHEVNWAKRRYFTALSGLFAGFLLLSGLYGLVFSFLRLREKRPYAELLREQFQLS